jgi:hypothetical protein
LPEGVVPGGALCRIVGRPFALDEGRALRALDPDRPATVDRALVELDGRFRLLLRTPTGTIVGATDGLGQGGLYYAERGGTVYLASHLGPLVATLAEVRLSRLGMASLLVTRGSVSGETPFEGIRRLMPGEVGIVRADERTAKLDIRRTTDPVEVLSTAADAVATGEDAVAAYRELLDSSLTRERLGPVVGLPLSGGRDSRSLGLLLVRRGDATLHAMTFGEPRSHDIRGAQAFARQYGIAHTAIPYRDRNVGSRAGLIVGLAGGASGLQTAHHLAGWEILRDHAPVAVLGNVLGDQLLWTDDDPDIVLRYTSQGLFNNPDIRPAAAFPDEVAHVVDVQRSRLRELAALPPVQAAIVLNLTIRQATYISVTADLVDWMIDSSFPGVHRGLLAFAFAHAAEHRGGPSFYDRWLEQELRGVEGSPGRRASLRSAVRGTREAVADALVPPRPKADWNRWTRRSAPWLLERTLADCPDPTLRELCLGSLETALRVRLTYFPAILVALAPVLALDLAGDSMRQAGSPVAA